MTHHASKSHRHPPKMKRTPLLLSVAVLVTALAFQGTASSAGPARVLAFGTMTPVAAPYNGPLNPIRGIVGGGTPWTLAGALGELRSDGTLQIAVAGLVVSRFGTNPVASFRGVVSCQTVVEGAAAVVNVATDPFPASSAGNSVITAKLSLPTPCIAPIVFVTTIGTAGGPGVWLAATGVG